MRCICRGKDIDQSLPGICQRCTCVLVDQLKEGKQTHNSIRAFAKQVLAPAIIQAEEFDGDQALRRLKPEDALAIGDRP